MATTRRSPPVQIFQDPVTTFDHSEVRRAEAALYSALGPLADASQDSAIALESSYPETSGLSPLKTTYRSSSPAAEALRDSDINAVRIPPPHLQSYKTDSMPKKQTANQSNEHTSRLSQSKVMFTAFQPPSSMDKENSITSSYGQTTMPAYSEALFNYTTAPKRPLADAASLRDRPQAKKAKLQAPETASNEPLPEPSDLPTFEDDGKKPSFSYAQLIGMAILRAPGRRLTLAQIYKWISETFTYYLLSENGWQNSIRHNLSLNKAFIKQERPKDDPGKGNYWAIEPGMERQFLKDKNARRGTISEGSNYHSLHEPIRPSTAPSLGGLPPSSMKHIDSSKFPIDEELSSDATIPASDPAIHDGIDDQGMPPPSIHHLRSSPPRGELGSSPPPMPAIVRDDTPPRAPRFPSTSRSGGRKRKFASLGDSGYWSSIESSLPRGGAARGVLLTSEVDTHHPSMKRGRAEEEILRMRSSSFDSPTKTRPILKGVGAPSALASSPFKPFEQPSRTPLTPPVVFKRPARPPKTVSPNTNLRNHRKRIAELVGSPDKSLSLLEASVWSPAPAAFTAGHIHDDFTIWRDDDISKAFELMDSPVARGSPEIRSAKRPNLSRAHTSSGALADVTGSARNARLGPAFEASKLSSVSLKSPMRFLSPLKQATSAPKLGPSPLRPGAAEFPDENELFSAALNSDDSDEAGFDILQGFQKIGTAPSMPPPTAPGMMRNGSPMKSKRPSMHRSTTSMF